MKRYHKIKRKSPHILNYYLRLNEKGIFDDKEHDSYMQKLLKQN